MAVTCSNCLAGSGPCEGSVFHNPTGAPGALTMVPCSSTRSQPTSPLVATAHHLFACTERRLDGSCCKLRPTYEAPKQFWHNPTKPTHTPTDECCGRLPAFLPVNQRPGWPTTWMRTAMEVARQSTCPRGGGCGAIFTTCSHELIVSGVNGSPRGLAHCYEAGCLLIEGHCRRTIHAEINGIIQATLSSRTLVGSYLYITYPPCINCALALVQAEVAQVTYYRPYETGQINEVALDILKEGHVLVQRFQEAV